ncbi:MAG: M23 family metallopeptidase [Caedimonas sp.]|nr:M23 family metallopeptidase [Caedimonas sp.]
MAEPGMLKRTVARLIVGVLCILIAFGYSVYDFLKHRPSYADIPISSPETEVASPEASCSASDSLSSESEITESEVIADEDIGPYEITLEIQKGDTLMSILVDAQIGKEEAFEIVDLLKKHFNPKDLKPHHKIYITYVKDEKNPSKRLIESLYFRPVIDKEFWIKSDEKGKFSLEKNEIKLNKITREARGKINDSLYVDAGKGGVPNKILHQMIQAFSYDVDFQRSFHPGDEYGLLYEMHADEDGIREEPRQLLYATLTLKSKKLHLYHFKLKDGTGGFYNQQGESVKKGLLRTPIDGARISSRFGKRRHPILGYTKAHKGIDFAAPTGTPIVASGDGVVMQAGPYANYGNYIRIKHNNQFSTAYAHLSCFAKGLRAGKAVKQGQIIGYVGSTGSSTGPHLHYELIRFNVQIDPGSVKMLPAAKLTGKELQAFKNTKDLIDKQYRQLYLSKVSQDETNAENEATDQDEETPETSLEPIEESRAKKPA